MILIDKTRRGGVHTYVCMYVCIHTTYVLYRFGDALDEKELPRPTLVKQPTKLTTRFLCLIAHCLWMLGKHDASK